MLANTYKNYTEVEESVVNHPAFKPSHTKPSDNHPASISYLLCTSQPFVVDTAQGAPKNPETAPIRDSEEDPTRLSRGPQERSQRHPIISQEGPNAFSWGPSRTPKPPEHIQTAPKRFPRMGGTWEAW